MSSLRLTAQEQRHLADQGWRKFIPPVKGCFYYKDITDHLGKPTGKQIALNNEGQEVAMPDLSDIDGDSDGSKASVKVAQSESKPRTRRRKKSSDSGAGQPGESDDSGNGQQGESTEASSG